MKREIKFRAWDTEKKEMLYPDDESYFTFGGSGNYFTFVKDGEIKVTKHEASLMQYTGVKDKNGKEIYEGDICHYLRRDYTAFDNDQERTFKVGWSSSQLRFGINDSNLPLAAFESENLEVIGNIFEDGEKYGL